MGKLNKLILTINISDEETDELILPLDELIS